MYPQPKPETQGLLTVCLTSMKSAIFNEDNSELAMIWVLWNAWRASCVHGDVWCYRGSMVCVHHSCLQAFLASKLTGEHGCWQHSYCLCFLCWVCCADLFWYCWCLGYWQLFYWEPIFCPALTISKVNRKCNAAKNLAI